MPPNSKQQPPHCAECFRSKRGTLPLIYAAYARKRYEQRPAIDSLVRLLRGRRERLDPTESLALDVLEADLRGDLDASLMSALELSRVLVGSMEARAQTAMTAMYLRRPAMALAELEGADPHRGLFLVKPRLLVVKGHVRRPSHVRPGASSTCSCSGSPRR